jgi:hypothetical protein
MKILRPFAILALMACAEPSPQFDAGRDSSVPRVDAAPQHDAGRALDAARALDAGMDAFTPSDAGAPDAGDECTPACLAAAEDCGAPDEVARAECERICGASPTEAELECLARLSCAASGCTYPTDLPCAIGVDDTEPIETCESICVATAERCGAPPEIAAARCAAACPLVETGEQLACLRDAPCAQLQCIEAEGHHPCGIGGGEAIEP